MNFEAIEEYLREFGEWERDNLLSLISDRTTDYQTRRYAWHVLGESAVFMRGFLYCIEICEDEETAQKYKEFFDQARSAKGLGGETEEE